MNPKARTTVEVQQPATYEGEAHIYVVTSAAICRKCGHDNRVATLGAVTDLYEFQDEDFKFFMLFDIRAMPPDLLDVLKSANPAYGLCFDELEKTPCYRNGCLVCDYVFEEEDLTFEPGDAFNPFSREDYARIRILDADYAVDYELREGDDTYRTFVGIECNWVPDDELWEWAVENQCD